MIHFMESISQCITAASPRRSVWMSFWGMICLARCAQAFPAYCTYAPQFIMFALGKSLLAWKACIGSHGRAGWHWCGWQEQPLWHSVVLTDVEIVRICQESPLELHPAINISGNNNQGCLFFPKLFVSMTDLFWRWLLFWQISRGWQWLLPVCVACAHADVVSATCAEMKPTGWECTRCTAGAILTLLLNVIARRSLKCLIFHKSDVTWVFQRWINIVDQWQHWCHNPFPPKMVSLKSILQGYGGLQLLLRL